MKLKTDINGPIKCYLNEFYFELLFFRYTEFTCRNYLLVFNDLNRWLQKNHVSLAAFNENKVNRFLSARKLKYTAFFTVGSISPLLNFFWERGLIPDWINPKVTKTPLDLLIERYEKYLAEDRNLSRKTIWIRKKIALDFLLKSCGKKACLKKLNVQRVRSYILQKKTHAKFLR